MRERKVESLTVLMLSDSTGETVRAATKAAASQFEDLDLRLHLYPFIRAVKDLEALDATHLDAADILVFTVVDPQIKERIRHLAQLHDLPALPLLEPLMEGIGQVLNRAPSVRPGQQYLVDPTYLDRVDAIDFAISHDDGVTEDYLLAADVILVGVSRSSKTPTCIYLGYQGVKAANVPLILNQPAPAHLVSAIAAGIPTIGLTVSAERLIQVRQTRLKSLGTSKAESYSDRRQIEEELVAARLFFDRYDLPVIDVTRRSIEETAASIRHILARASP